jgi:hypothetical protein
MRERRHLGKVDVARPAGSKGESGDAARVRTGTAPETVSGPLVRQFHEFWLSRCRDGRLPAKADLDPIEMRAFLRNVVLTEVHYDPVDFEYRIIGDELIAQFGNLTHRRVRDATLANVSTAYGNYCAVVESRRPQFLEGNALTAFRQDRPTPISRVHCPLASGDRVDHIISCIVMAR